MSDTEPSPTELTAEVCDAIAAHLGLTGDDVTPEMTLGADLALDSLGVLAVIEETGRRMGREVTLDHQSPAAAGRLGDLDTLTVADFAACLSTA